MAGASLLHGTTTLNIVWHPRLCVRIDLSRNPEVQALLLLLLGPSMTLLSSEMDMQALVVLDGSSDEHAALVDCLRRGGYNPVGVDSVQQARQALQDHQFALLFLDLGLPGASGLQLCEETRERLGAEMVIFFVSRDGTPYNGCVGLEFGADDFVLKPFNTEELLARIEAKLRRQRLITRG